MYALYKNMSLSISFSGDDGFKDKTQAAFQHREKFELTGLALLLANGTLAHTEPQDNFV